MVRILVSSRRPCDSDALATSSYGTNFAHPLSDATFVRAAVKVVLPWSICPIVPTFTCGLLRSNFSLAMSSTSSQLRFVVQPGVNRRSTFRLPPSPLRGYGGQVAAMVDKSLAHTRRLACQP